MKTFVAAALISLASVATAQLENIPSCALSCFLTPLGSDGCSQLTDFKCHCQKFDTLISAVTPCVQKACSSSDQAAVISGVTNTCKAAGVSVSVPSSAVASASSMASSASSKPSSMASSASSMASSMASSASSMASSMASSASSQASMSMSSSASESSKSATSVSSTSASSTPPPQSNNAASHFGSTAGALGAAAVAFFAL